jgi:mono/diheme cytochrome c family protein
VIHRSAPLVLCVLIGMSFFAGCARKAQQPLVISTPSAVADGRAIFQTGKDLAGTQITANPAPLYPTCAACHKADGSGGMHLPGGATSADLRRKALASSSPAYTLALLERAISTGIDNQGKPLDKVMPRWTLSKTDLHDVAYYVLTQLK